MRFVSFGAGGIGGVVGAARHQAGQEVHRIAHGRARGATAAGVLARRRVAAA